MKKSITYSLLFILLLGVIPIFAQSSKSFSDLAAKANIQVVQKNAPQNANVQSNNFSQANGIAFYFNENSFDSSCVRSNIITEDFEGSNVAPGGLCISNPNEVLDSLTNNACFSPGAVVPGFTFSIIENGGFNSDYVVLGQGGAFGVPNTSIAPNDFVDDTAIDFDNEPNRVSFNFVSANGNNIAMKVSAFGAGNALLGDVTVIGNGLNPTFVGISSDQAIERVVIEEADPSVLSGTLLTDLSFGTCTEPAVPTMSQWALLLFGIVIMTLATVTLYNFKRRGVIA